MAIIVREIGDSHMAGTRNVVSQKSALTGFSHCFAALRYSLQGFAACFKQESAFRQECALGIPHFILLYVIEMDAWMRVLLGVLWFLLIAIELLNSAIEAVVDLASPEHHDLARKAKDCGSAAVMVLIVALIICWALAISNCSWSVSK